jgi:hypothetical protein
MWHSREATEFDEAAMRRQILAFLDEYCRGITLQDVREWYVDAFGPDPFPIAEAWLS